MTIQAQPNAIARGILESLSDTGLTLKVSGTEYQLDLALSDSDPDVTTPIGKRIKGTIRAKALKVHPAQGGGLFIEPINGTPRIVAGSVLAVDEEAGAVLVDVGVPMWVEVSSKEDFDTCAVGTLVNFYVESGAVFSPL